MTDRQLATIRTISSLTPIDGADKIELARVDGWNVVVQKGLYEEGDLAVYFEVDSWIPHDLADFLTKPGHEPKEFEGIKGQRLRTIRLRGQLSQGLLMPTHIVTGPVPDPHHQAEEGQDYTEKLGILKWERPIPAQLAGLIKGSFPSFLRKTDQNRIQNLQKDLEGWKTDRSLWEVTEKLDGSPMTVYRKDGEFGVCSRNLELKPDENNAFWKAAYDFDLENKCPNNYALQGELVGPGIQGNPYGFSTLRFFVYDLWSISGQCYADSDTASNHCRFNDLDYVPIVNKAFYLDGSTTDSLLAYAEGNSLLKPDTKREGLVFKRYGDEASFKAISNSWLLKSDSTED